MNTGQNNEFALGKQPRDESEQFAFQLQVLSGIVKNSALVLQACGVFFLIAFPDLSLLDVPYAAYIVFIMRTDTDDAFHLTHDTTSAFQDVM